MVDNSNDPRITDCMACQIALYSRSHVLVGLHGAGELFLSHFCLFVGIFVCVRGPAMLDTCVCRYCTVILCAAPLTIST